MNEEHYLLFDQYLANELSLEEKTTFEKQLIEEAELSTAFKTFKDLQLHLENKFRNADELDAFKKNLNLISNEHFEAKKTKIVRFKPWQYAVAASVAVLFGLFFMQNINPSFEDYNTIENASFVERSSANESLKLAQDAFNTKKFKTAIPYFEAVLNTNKSAEIQYFYAISLVEENHYQKAETNLLEIRKGNSIYKTKASWFLALSKLKQKDYKFCKEILQTIPDDYEDYDQVQELLNELD